MFHEERGCRLCAFESHLSSAVKSLPQRYEGAPDSVCERHGTGRKVGNAERHLAPAPCCSMIAPTKQDVRGARCWDQELGNNTVPSALSRLSMSWCRKLLTRHPVLSSDMDEREPTSLLAHLARERIKPKCAPEDWCRTARSRRGARARARACRSGARTWPMSRVLRSQARTAPELFFAQRNITVRHTAPRRAVRRRGRKNAPLQSHMAILSSAWVPRRAAA